LPAVFQSPLPSIYVERVPPREHDGIANAGTAEKPAIAKMAAVTGIQPEYRAYLLFLKKVAFTTSLLFSQTSPGTQSTNGLYYGLLTLDSTNFYSDGTSL